MKTMIQAFIFTAVILLLTSPIQAKEMDFDNVKEGSRVVCFPVDLNRDGKLEEVSVKAYNVTEEEYFGQLVVMDSKGATLWEGPRVKDRKNREPFLFGAFIDGCSLPEIVADIDGDGKVEMLSTAPVSDVRQVPFLEFRWDGRKFVYLQQKALVETSKGSGVFAWKKAQGYAGGWIMNFESSKGDNTYLVFIFTNYDGKAMSGKAEVRPIKDGFKVIRWTEALKPVII
ncbi:MAG: FG-GAP repeat domain-containing protein [Candidatus Xenobiia bacterium LiM19]